MYQGVTVGALNSAKTKKKSKRHPTIEDNVIIYSGATILGDITIGRDCVIGGNAWVTFSVPPNSLVYNQSEVADKDSFSHKDSVSKILKTTKKEIVLLGRLAATIVLLSARPFRRVSDFCFAEHS
ncbi:serine O-acetyltransferase [Niabella hibiscisoli]|uniref:serine O-acetyltransferase n=1 Tax=Niabella hibiscisoli TaxID=1825928 RepID=UPI001F0F6028|nr:hypothetical protein [Niabella hibiscisoli]MCH5715403.1 hypothetical protein [Niabella hibiscisoli]